MKRGLKATKRCMTYIFIEDAQLPHNESSVGFRPQVIDGELTEGGDIATLWPVLGASLLHTHTHTLNREDF